MRPSTLLLPLIFASATLAQPLTPTQTIPLPAVEGRIDHFALDEQHNRLFMAALGNDTVEVIDLAAGKVVGRIPGLAAPQGVGFAPDANRLAVANDKDGSVRLYDAASLKQVATVDLKDDADNVRYDAAAKQFWVGYGDGALARIDPATGKTTADVKLDGHPESFQLEARGKRIFVNVPHARHVAVIDREAGKVTDHWKLSAAAGNFPMALDEAHGRLFVGCRQPARLLVLDTKTGKEVTAIPIVGDTDDVFYDASRRRIYATGGEGAITIVDQKDPNNYALTTTIKTAPGARTGFFVPATKSLYVAVPHRGDRRAEIRVFRAKK
jgi:DNA-binding beta-propeller fold protein YncE